MRKHHQPQLLCLLLALCLLPLAGLAQQPAPERTEYLGRILAEQGGSILSMTTLAGKVYLRSQNALYLLEGRDQKVRQVAKLPDSYNSARFDLKTFDTLFVHEGRLMGFNLNRGIVYELAVKEDQVDLNERLRLDWEEFTIRQGDFSYVETPLFSLASGGRLYVKLANHSSNRDSDLYSYDLNTGEQKRHGPLHLNYLTPYKDGKLLCNQFDQNDRDPDTHESKPARMVVFDPATDSVEELKLLLPPASGDNTSQRNLILYYAAEQDLVYGVTGDGLWRLSADKEAVKVARLPMPNRWISGGRSPMVHPFGEGELLIGLEENLFLRPTDESLMKPVRQLKANTAYLHQKAVTQALIALGDVELVGSEQSFLDTERAFKLFLTGEMDLDILTSSSREMDWQRLMQKGYLAPLDEHEGLKAIGEDSYPAYHPLMYHEGRMYSLPVDLQSDLSTGFPKRFEEMGRELPQSFEELLDFAAWWGAEGAEKHPEYQLLDTGGDTAQGLKAMAYERYIASVEATGQPLSFDMEGFGSLMQKIDAIGFKPANPNGEDMGQSLIYTNVGMSINDDGPDSSSIMPLPLKKGMPEYRKAYGSFLAVTATSKEPELARSFLKAYWDSMDTIQRAMMSKSWSEPVPNPYFDSQLQSITEQVNGLAKLVEGMAEGAERRQNEEELERTRASLIRFEENQRYQVSTAALARFKKTMDEVYLQNSLQLTADAALNKEGSLFYSYLQGAVTLPQFIKQANDRIRLMTLEMQ